MSLFDIQSKIIVYDFILGDSILHAKKEVNTNLGIALDF